MSALTASAEAAVTTADLSVRSGPGGSHSRIDVIPRGTYVDTGRCVQGGWCHVEWSGRDGWAYSGYISEGGNNRRGWGDRDRWNNRDRWDGRDRWNRGSRWDRDRWGRRDRRDDDPEFYIGVPGFSLSYDDDNDRRRWGRGRRGWR